MSDHADGERTDRIPVTSATRIIFLDQNKWIELLRAEAAPASYPLEYEVLEALSRGLMAGKIVLPLSATNIYETYKIGDPKRRDALGFLQARLSGGLVFRGRHHRLESELAHFLGQTYRIVTPYRAPWWFLSDMFPEAFADHEDERMSGVISPAVAQAVQENGGLLLHDYFRTATDDERQLAIRHWSDASVALCARIEGRRVRHQSEPMAMRRRIYGVLMISDALDHLIALAARHGVDWSTADKIGSSVARRIATDIPIYHTERELVLRLEAQSRPINENDLRDVQAYCAALIYADLVVGENHLVNLARQARLGKKYGTRIETSLSALKAYLQSEIP